ncbi:MAG: hydantoinase B/oxoprolinase family protein, partial [Bryobacteraceae bacterium]
DEREGDLGAQIAACHTGAQRLREVCGRYGVQWAGTAAEQLLDYSEQMMRSFLQRVPEGTYRAEDFMDGDGISERRVKIAVAVRFSGNARNWSSDPAKTGSSHASGSRGGISLSPMVAVDFTGSDSQVEGSINAVEAITYSACLYVFRCLLDEDVPATAGLMRPIRVVAPEGTVVNARAPAAVAGGNVETSQRIVDVLLRAFSQMLPDRIPAASSGTMNNLTIGGIDGRTGEPFAYYETVAGGAGARPNADGVSGVHTHMTNSLNTPVEALEYAYPFRVRRYSYRRGSGGKGQYNGGDGLIREIELLSPAQVTLLADRRVHPPYGLHGGAPGACGRTSLTENGNQRPLPGKCNVEAPAGATIRIETPGGGGWGQPENIPAPVQSS